MGSMKPGETSQVAARNHRKKDGILKEEITGLSDKVDGKDKVSP